MENQISINQLIKAITGAAEQIKKLDLITAEELYLDNVKLNQRPATYDQYYEDLNYINKFNLNAANHLNNINDLNIGFIQEFQKAHINKVKNKTINKRIKVLIACYNYCLRNEYIDGKYIKYKALKEEKVINKPISKQDIQKALNYAKEFASNQNYIMLKFMIATGIRTEELTQIENKNIDFKKYKILLSHTKNGEQEYISFQILKNEIKEIYDSNYKYLFHPEGSNTKLEATAVKSFFARIKRKLDLKVFNPHRIRHYYATQLYKQTKDIYFVSKALRHKSIEITKVYLDVKNDAILNKQSELNPLKEFI